MELKSIIESVLFSAQKPLSAKEIKELLRETAGQSDLDEVSALKKVPVDKIISALEELAQEHETAQRSYRLICVAGAWQFASLPEYAPWLKTLVGHKSRPPRLSQPALETLAIIAYRQPLTRAEMEQVRGVSVDGVLTTLLDRGLVEQVGRAEVIGRPMTYATTPQFLEYFGLKDLEDLPEADELRRVPVERPESLLTVDAGLATAPPEELASEDPDDPGAAEASDDASSSTSTGSSSEDCDEKRPQHDPVLPHPAL